MMFISIYQEFGALWTISYGASQHFLKIGSSQDGHPLSELLHLFFF
jgi:hypothetical protein